MIDVLSVSYSDHYGTIDQVSKYEPHLIEFG